MSNIKKNLIIFLFGGFIYGLTEIIWRGHTHWSMVLTGGAVFLALRAISHILKGRSFFLLVLAGGCMITATEFLVGCIVNLWLGLKVWDYSSLPLNLFGQICPEYFIFWLALCIPAFPLCGFIEKKLSAPETGNRDSF